MNRATVEPTFTPGRVLFLLLIGPLTFAATAAAIYYSPEGWAWHTDWSTGHPLVIAGHAHTGGGRRGGAR
jgi:hypothetical protein